MRDDLKKGVEAMCTRDRVLAAARARSLLALLELVQRRHDPIAYETQADYDEDQEGDYR